MFSTGNGWLTREPAPPGWRGRRRSLPLPSTRLFLATLCYGGQASARCTRSLLALRAACARAGIGLHTELAGGEALASRGRAALMAKFLDSDATHLLFIDNDVAFEPEAVFQLLAAAKSVIGGVYPKTSLPQGPVTWDLDELDAAGADSLRRVAGVGAGFLLIARDAAQRLSAAYPQMKARLGDLGQAQASEAVMVFDALIEPATGRYLTDGQALCHRWRAIGGEVWADFGSPLEHVPA